MQPGVAERGAARKRARCDAAAGRRLGARPGLQDDAIVCGDSGQNTLDAARQIRIRETQRFSCSGLLASMGCAPFRNRRDPDEGDHRPLRESDLRGELAMSLGELMTCAK